MAIVIEKGDATSVDHNNYDLTLYEAAAELAAGRNIIAREFDDYEDDFSFPMVDDLEAENYSAMSVEEIAESIRAYYELFGRSVK